MNGIEHYNAHLICKLDRIRDENRKLREALLFISQQFCIRCPESGPPFDDCTTTGDCITEYCLPCFAAVHLRID